MSMEEEKKYKWDIEDIREKARAVNAAEKDTSWEERFDFEFEEIASATNLSKMEDLKQFIRQEREALLKEIIDLSDKIEMEGDDGGIGQWKAFKHLRNTLRDKS